jgi:FemAB-related protein (PEP-CTERM system-associated)
MGFAAARLDESVSSHIPVRVEVRSVEAADALRWDEYVERHADATFFHRLGWRSILEEVFRHRPHYLIAERDRAICGVLPLAEVRSRLFGHALVSLPFCVYGGPVADDAASEQALLAHAVELGRTLGVRHLEVRNRSVKCREWPREDIYVTFRKALDANADINMRHIPRKQRAMVRKGIARGLRSERDASCDRFFALYADNVHRHGTPALPKSYFERLMATFGESCEVLTVTDPGGNPVSAVLSFYYRDEVLPYYAGDTERARDLAANDFKYWELMRRACARGARIFDYGRSKVGTGSYHFKKNWGFEPVPLAYEYELYGAPDIPRNNPLNPRYAAMIALWRRLPRPVVNRLGPWVVRGLG